MNESSARGFRTDLSDHIRAYQKGEPGADDALLRELRGPVAADVSGRLRSDHPDHDDVIQESLMAALRYLQGDDEFAGDLVRLAVTIARNRIRDIGRRQQRRPSVDADSLGEWLADPGQSILDEIEHTELMALLQSALHRASDDCRDLLRWMYLENRAAEEVRRWLGLETVQGVYYRRSTCLRRVKTFLIPDVHGRSGHRESRR